MQLQVGGGSLVTIFVGLCFIAAGVYGYVHTGRFLNSAQETSAVVLEVAYESNNKKGRIHPVVRFNTADGREIVVRTDEHHNVQPGDTVRLLYHRNHPQQTEITTMSRAQNRRLVFALLSVAVGSFVCLMGLGVIRTPG